MIPTVAFIALGYILGSIPFGLLLTKAAGLGDIRTVGSGNIGATNVLRTGKRGLAAGTLILDAGKGAVAVLIAAAVGGPIAALWAGLGAVLGHLFPVWLGFRGGKGVATALGVLLAAAWLAGLVACATWLAAAAVLRISSAASLIALAVAVPVAWALAGPATALLALAIALLVFVRHAANIRRLLGGTEPHIGAKG